MIIGLYSYAFKNVLSVEHSPVAKAFFVPFEVVSKCGKTSNVAIWNATARFLHHLQGVSIQHSCDLESKESLHLTQLSA